MNAKITIKELQAFIRKLKKQPITVQIRKAIERGKALIAYYREISPKNMAQVLNVRERTIKNWVNKFTRYGLESLYDEARGGSPKKLTTEQESELKKIVGERNQKVWTARHVYHLILTTTGVIFSVKYLPQLLGRIGLSFHKTMYDLVKRDSEKRRKWIQEKLPEIYREQIQEGWRVF